MPEDERMTRAQWLGCTDPAKMLHFLQGKTSERKLRLFAVACCRRIWDRMTERSSRHAVRIGERYADGKATFEEREAAFSAADRAFSAPLIQRGLATWHAADAARQAAHPEMGGLADGTATAAAMAGAGSTGDFWGQYAGEQAHQCMLLRDIFGNSLPSVVIDPSWATSKAGTVVRLAQAIYDQLAFDRLPRLADTLEEAGCDSADILAHCRSPGPHVRGCWVVDLMLGKN
jgi:hypothetical protein